MASIAGHTKEEANSNNFIVRMKEDYDGFKPAGNSVSVKNLVLLSRTPIKWLTICQQPTFSTINCAYQVRKILSEKYSPSPL
ncbi:hypothetical protein DMENIID0001_139580 [Sergentomyia squamirostris]